VTNFAVTGPGTGHLKRLASADAEAEAEAGAGAGAAPSFALAAGLAVGTATDLGATLSGGATRSICPAEIASVADILFQRATAVGARPKDFAILTNVSPALTR
jgi:hypothetical protein